MHCESDMTPILQFSPQSDLCQAISELRADVSAVFCVCVAELMVCKINKQKQYDFYFTNCSLKH